MHERIDLRFATQEKPILINMGILIILRANRPLLARSMFLSLQNSTLRTSPSLEWFE